MTLKMLNDFLYQIECAYEDCIKSDDFEFEDTPKFDKVFDILYSKYYKIGSGSSRRVWALDKNTVIKMAKNEKGIAQNLVELKVFEKAPEPSVDETKPVRFLGKITQSGNDIVLLGRGVYQQLKGNALK